jgi:predicted nucleic acid-binding Zn ribbon protein
VPDDDDLHPLVDSVDAVVKALRGPSAKAVAGVFARWEEAVGPDVAAHARPVALRDGVLLVEVDEPGWATQLRYLQGRLVERLRAVAGAASLHAIELRVGRR